MSWLGWGCRCSLSGDPLLASKVYQECIDLAHPSLSVSRIDTSILFGDRVVIHITPPYGFLCVFTSEQRRHQ
jgi:hypothetical protein